MEVKKKYIVDNAGKLPIEKRKELMDLMKTFYINMIGCADGTRVNLDILDKIHVDKIYLFVDCHLRLESLNDFSF